MFVLHKMYGYYAGFHQKVSMFCQHGTAWNILLYVFLLGIAHELSALYCN